MFDVRTVKKYMPIGVTILIFAISINHAARAESIKIYEETPNSRVSPGMPSTFSLSREGKLIAVGVKNSLTSKAEIFLIDTRYKNKITEIPVEKGVVSSIDFSPDLTKFAYSSDGKVFLVDVSNGAVLAESQKFVNSPKITFSPDGKRLLMSEGGMESVTKESLSYSLCVLDISGLKLKWCAGKTAGNVASSNYKGSIGGEIAWVSGGAKFISGGAKGNFLIWNSLDYSFQELTGNSHYRIGWPVTFSNDESFIYSIANSNVLTKWSAASGELLLGGDKKINGGYSGSASAIWVTSNGQKIVLADTGSQNPSLVVVNAETLKQMGKVSLPIHRSKPDDWIMTKTIISSSKDFYAFLYRSERGEPGKMNPSDIFVEVGKIQ